MDQYNRFYALSSEKQSTIIDAAIKEFIQQGFASASTNRIAQKAGISKGSLFNYFGSKEGLYLYLIGFCEEKLFEQMKPVLEKLSPDLIQRLYDLAEGYLNLYIEDVQSFQFLMTLTNSGNRELAQRYRQLSKDSSNGQLGAMFSGIDMSTLRLEYPDVLRVITWTLSGLKDGLLNTGSVYEDPVQFKSDFLKDYSLLLDVLKKGVYR